MKNSKRSLRVETITSIAIFTVAVVLLGAILTITGCDVGMNMTEEVVGPKTEPTQPEPTTTGEMKQPEETEPDEEESDKPADEQENPSNEAVEPQEPPTPPEPPTITIETITSGEDGSITVVGSSTNLPEEAEVTITLGDITVTATVNEAGVWSTTVPAEEANALTAGKLIVTAHVGEVTTPDTPFEHTPLVHGVPVSTEEERIEIEILADMFDYDHSTASEAEKRDFGWMQKAIVFRYGRLNVETSMGRAAFRRFIEYEQKGQALLSRPPRPNELEILDQYFEEAFGFPRDYAKWLVFNIYLEERPKEKNHVGIWQSHSTAFEYFLIKLENPDATEEEWLELLRESIKAGNVSIQSSDWTRDDW